MEVSRGWRKSIPRTPFFSTLEISQTFLDTKYTPMTQHFHLKGWIANSWSPRHGSITKLPVVNKPCDSESIFQSLLPRKVTTWRVSREPSFPWEESFALELGTQEDPASQRHRCPHLLWTSKWKELPQKCPSQPRIPPSTSHISSPVSYPCAMTSTTACRSPPGQRECEVKDGHFRAKTR